MRADVPNETLSEVWAALTAIRVRGAGRSITDLGFVTAASSDGAGMLVLLCLPARLCRTTEDGDHGILERVEDALRGVSALRDVELTVTPSSRRTAEFCTSPGQPEKHPLNAPAVEMNGHSGCVSNTLTGRLLDGWALDGFQRGARPFRTPDGAERTEVFRVVVEARIATGGECRHVTSPRGAA